MTSHELGSPFKAFHFWWQNLKRPYMYVRKALIPGETFLQKVIEGRFGKNLMTAWFRQIRGCRRFDLGTMGEINYIYVMIFFGKYGKIFPDFRHFFPKIVVSQKIFKISKKKRKKSGTIYFPPSCQGLDQISALQHSPLQILRHKREMLKNRIFVEKTSNFAKKQHSFSTFSF